MLETEKGGAGHDHPGNSGAHRAGPGHCLLLRAEGLISPARQANGYRDYSDADLTALRRIRLLRQLGLSLEQLRAVQAGAEALPDILAGRLAELERQQTDNARALAVCRAIRETGVAFDQLDPDAFDLAAGPAVRDALHPARCGARRALARALDAALCTLPVTALLTLALHRNPLREWPLFLAAELAGVLLLTRLLEPWLLGRFGATPGKALLGLRVEDAGGGTLTGAQAAGRTGQLLRFWRWPRALRQYRKAGLCPWDEAGSLLLTARRRKPGGAGPPPWRWRCGWPPAARWNNGGLSAPHRAADRPGVHGELQLLRPV